jgi:hypothetical protein
VRINATTRCLTALLVAGLVLTGCGKSDDKEPAGADPTPTASATPTPTPTPTPTATPKPTRTPTKPAEGDGDSEGDDTPATAGGGICADLEPGDISEILGGDVTGSALPGGGCVFDQRDPSYPAASLVEASYAATDGGMDGAKEAATSSIEGEPQNLSGIGDAAFVVTGTAFGGDAIQGGGAVRIDDRLISVTLAQPGGLSRAKVKAMVLSLLRLAVTQAT